MESLGAPRTRYVQPAAYPVIPCNVGLLTCDSHRCTDAPIRHSPSFDPRLGLQNCSHRVPYEVARPITYSNFCVSLSSLLHWDGGTYHPSFHCQQKKQHKQTKNRKNNKNNILFHSFVSDSFLFLSFFSPNIYILHWFFLFLWWIFFQGLTFLLFLLVPCPSSILARDAGTAFGTGLANPCHCWRNTCLPLQLHLYTAPTPVLEQITIAIV